MSRMGRVFGTLGVTMFALVGAMPAMSASAATYTHYGPPNSGPWSLAGHSVAAGAGTLPNGSPGPHAWDQPAGDYCSAYKFAQPNAPTTNAPFLTWSDTNLKGATGFDPAEAGVPREQTQLRHNAQADSSACQAQGQTWGFWANANTYYNYCVNWCGVRHDYSTGQATGTRPWANGYGSGARLVMSARRNVQTFQGDQGMAYMCAMLQDTTTGQRLEYCLRVWRSWSQASAYDEPKVFHDPSIGLLGTGFTTIATDVTSAGTPYAQSTGDSDTVVGDLGERTYSGAISRTHLVNAINDANARVKAMNLGTCLGLPTLIRCYSTDPDKYALFGVEDGLELKGNPPSHMGGSSTGLHVYTDY